MENFELQKPISQLFTEPQRAIFGGRELFFRLAVPNISRLSLQLLKLVHNCEDHFHFYNFLVTSRLYRFVVLDSCQITEEVTPSSFPLNC